MDTPTLTPFKITPESIEVDGLDLTDAVRGYELVAGFNDVPRLVLHLNGGSGQVAGLAHLSLAGSVDPAAAVRALDPTAIRDRCLNDLNDDFSMDPYAAAKEVIAQMLSEQAQ